MGLSIETMADCASCFGVFKVPGSKPGVAYTVHLGGESWASCNCPAYTFSKKPAYDRTCKHIDTIWNRQSGACLYNPQWNKGLANPGFMPVDYTNGDFVTSETCPACGGPVIAVRRAV